MITRIGVSALFVFALVGCNNAPVAVSEPKPRHPVTEKMWSEAKTLDNVAVPKFELKDQFGKEQTLESLAKGKPLVLYFIKEGCPCSVDLEPLMQRLAKAVDGNVSVAGVISGNAKVAEKWMKVGQTPYPVLLDGKMELIKAFKAERSTYTALVRPDGTVERLWPGYSKDMLLELAKSASELARIAPQPFDPAYAPKTMTSGCSFYSDDPGV